MAGTADDVEQSEPTVSIARETADGEPAASEGTVTVTTEAEATVEVTTVTTKVTVKRKLEEQGAEEPREVEEMPASEPVKQKKLKFEDVYLRAIPRASQYEKSFMHRDVITHVIATKTDFIITASQDGHLKFWKKKHNEGIEFVKHFRCHLHEFSCIAVNHNGTLMATVCTADKSVKVFDVPNFDMINMFNLDFSPRMAAWVHQGSDIIHSLAVSDANSGKIIVLDGRGTPEPVHVLENLHNKPVELIDYSAALDVVISVDEMGMVEYWSGAKNDYGFPTSVDWSRKLETDLYEFIKLKQCPRSIAVSPTGTRFATVGADRIIRVFDVLSGKIVKRLDESLQRYLDLGKETKGHGLQNMEWNRRVATEKEMSRDPAAFRHLRVTFDESGNFLIYPTPLGIRVYNLYTDEVVRELGKGENVRFVGMTLCRAVPDATEKLQGAATSINVEAAENPNLRRSEPDPMLIACAHKRNRFYIFTNQEPYAMDDDDEGVTSRDVFNEKPLKEDTITAVEQEDARQTKLCDKAIIHTTFGDIHVEMYPDKCPKAVENFCTHARRGYYNGHTFHRVIKSFMIQTGDPTGKGTGGQSIWGADFEDEFHPTLRHDKPYCLSMANAGPNTNGSQFFVTVVPAEWLDGKNTLFGHVTEGLNVVQKINQVPTFEKSGRPRQEISIISISLKT